MDKVNVINAQMLRKMKNPEIPTEKENDKPVFPGKSKTSKMIVAYLSEVYNVRQQKELRNTLKKSGKSLRKQFAEGRADIEMKLDTKKGEKVKFLNKNGCEQDLKYAAKIFKKGDILTVDKVEIGGFSSKVFFKETGEKNFNTVMFENL